MKKKTLPIYETASEAGASASLMAASGGEAFCIISRFSRKRGHAVYSVLPLRGFGLPAGWSLEDSVMPGREKVEPEPPEKTSTNGF